MRIVSVFVQSANRSCKMWNQILDWIDRMTGGCDEEDQPGLFSQDEIEEHQDKFPKLY